MSEERIKDITRSNNLFAPAFVYRYILPDVNFNVHCLINNNISISNSNKYIFFLHAKSITKRFKYRFYIRYLLVSICRAN